MNSCPSLTVVNTCDDKLKKLSHYVGHNDGQDFAQIWKSGNFYEDDALGNEEFLWKISDQPGLDKGIDSEAILTMVNTSQLKKPASATGTPPPLTESDKGIL